MRFTWQKAVKAALYCACAYYSQTFEWRQTMPNSAVSIVSVRIYGRAICACNITDSWL